MNTKITEHQIGIKDLNINYLSAGEGEIILLLHGWPTSSYLWRNIMPDLAKNNHVIAIDLPGFGKSSKRPEDSYSFKFYSRIIADFLNQLKIENITLGVHDLGGPLGLYWAVHNQKRVNGLILFNTLVYPDFSWAVKLFGLATFLPGIRTWISSPTGIKWAMNFGVYQKEDLPAEVIHQYQAPFQDKVSRQVLRKTVQRLSPKGFKDIERLLPNFQCPVQIIYGEEDRILPDVAKTMARVKKDLPQAQVVSIPNCGHFLQEEVPEKIGEVLGEFMKI